MSWRHTIPTRSDAGCGPPRSVPVNSEPGRSVRNILARHEGEITQENHWGVRRLAYEIDDESKGNYMFLKFRSQGTACTDLDKFLRLDDQVLRHLVVVDDEWDERNRVAIAKRRQKAAASGAAAGE